MEQFENLYGNIMSMIENENQIPKEVMSIIMDVFYQIEEIYKQNRCNNSSILEGIDLESNVIRGMLNGTLSDDMRNEQFIRTSEVLKMIEEKLKEIEQKSNKISEEEFQDIENDMQNRARDGISEIGVNNQQVTSTIMMVVEDALKDIRSRQNTILYNRGELSVDVIYDIQQQVQDVIRQFQNKEQDIFDIFQQKDKQLQKDILHQFEEYMQYRAQLRKEKSEIPERKAEVLEEQVEAIFRESLKAGIPLEEQAKSAEQFLREQEEKEEQNPKGEKLLVDELPELLL